jgi:translocator protein
MALKTETHPKLLLIAFIMVLIGISMAIGYLTPPGQWYADLAKSSLTPPGWVFGVVWPVLYALMGIAAWRIWQLPQSPDRTSALKLFALQLAMNYGWSFLFFSWHLITLSAAWIVVLLQIVVLTKRRFCKLDKTAGWLLVPYLLWLCFALYLNAYIWYANT